MCAPWTPGGIPRAVSDTWTPLFIVAAVTVPTSTPAAVRKVATARSLAVGAVAQAGSIASSGRQNVMRMFGLSLLLWVQPGGTWRVPKARRWSRACNRNPPDA
jgi:hypothetical protein